MPWYPDKDDGSLDQYETATAWERLVAEYSGMSFLELEQLDHLDYLVLRRDAFIHLKRQSEEGREWLKNAYRLTNTEMDYAGLEKFAKK